MDVAVDEFQREHERPDDNREHTEIDGPRQVRRRHGAEHLLILGPEEQHHVGVAGNRQADAQQISRDLLTVEPGGLDRDLPRLEARERAGRDRNQGEVVRVEPDPGEVPVGSLQLGVVFRRRVAFDLLAHLRDGLELRRRVGKVFVLGTQVLAQEYARRKRRAALARRDGIADQIILGVKLVALLDLEISPAQPQLHFRRGGEAGGGPVCACDLDFVFATRIGTPLDGPNVTHAFEQEPL